MTEYIVVPRNHCQPRRNRFYTCYGGNSVGRGRGHAVYLDVEGSMLLKQILGCFK
jgi:hypothetical protein